MLFTKLEILAQRAQPLPPWEGPEGECVLRRRLGFAVVDRLIGIVKRRPADQVQGRQEQLAAGELGTVRAVPESPGRDPTIDEAADPGLGVVPQLAPAGRE